MKNDLDELRNISNFYYNVSGIYQRACDYISYLYRYDWYIVPEIYDENNIKEDKVLKDFWRTLNFFDNSNIKDLSGQIAHEVVVNGCYYGYIVPSADNLSLQQLPAKYCRTRYFSKGRPAIEFNMSFFDTFRDPSYRLKVLKMFPDEFSKGYLLYKQGKLIETNETTILDRTSRINSSNGWYLLNIDNTVKFNINNSDVPFLVSSVPALIDLDAAQDLDRRKQMQQLLKILIQKLPRDKNGDLIFDSDEARDIHNNAVQMLRRAIGVDVLTTFAEIDAIDMSDKNTTTTSDDLKKIERTVFNAMGLSQNLFNTDGNMSLQKSILNDESALRGLLLQLSSFFNRVCMAIGTNKKKYTMKFYMLETTQNNYMDLSKMYKEQTQIGYSKLLPQIALGHSQTSILNSAKFENKILKLTEIMIPPLMSSTMSSEDVLNKDSNEGGRPEKNDDQKSDKTIANLEAMG